MIGNYLAPLSGSKRILLAALATSALFVTGCANMASTAPETNPFSSGATLKGVLHGGNQPVSGATVNLWFAGQLPSASILAATTTSANDGTGSFSFVKNPTNGIANSGTTNQFSCPSSGGGNDPLVYVVAKGGNTINDGDATKNNTAAAFIAIYGRCSLLSSASQVYMSEATTAATMAAVSQFFNPVTETIAADGVGQQLIIINQMPSTIALLANLTTGNAATSTTINAPTSGGNINPGITVTATPEVGKINLIANIISSCINNANSSASQCATLFSAAVPPIPNTTNFNPSTLPAATDTLQALYYMFTNPASTNSTTPGTGNITSLFNLAGGAGAPYQPYPNVQPTDWTIAVSYTSTGACGTPTGGTGAFINSPVDIAIDASDNVWFANSQTTTGNLSELAAGGVPIACVLPGTGAVGGTVIDAAQNVWVGTANGMVRYNPATTISLTFPTPGNPVALAADGVNNVYFSSVSGSTGSLYQLPLAATSGAAVTPAPISQSVGPNPIRIMPDFKGVNATLNNIWVTSGSTFVSQVAAGTGGGAIGGFLTTKHTVAGTNAYGLSITTGGNIFVGDDDATNYLNQLVPSNNNPSNISYASAPGFPFVGAAAGISSPTMISVDPRGNTWLANNANGSATGSASEVSNGGIATSPSTGFQKALTYLSSGRALAIDQAGNVWIAGDGANFLTEIVGGSVPIFQPYAVGLKVGRFQKVP